jgi:hypothetical protein
VKALDDRSAFQRSRSCLRSSAASCFENEFGRSFSNRLSTDSDFGVGVGIGIDIDLSPKLRPFDSDTDPDTDPAGLWTADEILLPIFGGP